MPQSPALPEIFGQWFAQQSWQLRPYQRKMLRAFAARQSTLLIAPTGAGKTLSGFLPSLVDLYKGAKRNQASKGLHTLYISPLKALAQDIQRNLQKPIDDMQLPISVGVRSGDTSSYERQKQKKSPPNILLTTPESLMLMLSYADADRIFSQVRMVIIDEAHSFAHSKRGDFTALALARLTQHSPNMQRVGLSATVAQPEVLANWLGHDSNNCQIVQVKSTVKPSITLLKSKARIPFGGNMARYAGQDMYEAICAADTTLVFVNTRAQAELIFQQLWECNTQALPIAIYHGSLSKEQRSKTDAMMAAGQLRAIVATSALELGIDWGDVDLVIQVGAPKGVSRLLQRIGRSNHRFDEPSQALLVPANRFEALECLAAMQAIKQGELDGESLSSGALDILPQFIMNCLCSQAADINSIYHLVTQATPYAGVDFATFEKLWWFTVNGGNALQGYERYHRLISNAQGLFSPVSKRVVMRHRQNIGTIVEAGRLRVKRLRRSHQGKVIGEVEEYFAQQLVPGDSFYFAGEILEFVGIRDMFVEAKRGKAKTPKIPSYVGGQMPLSTYLADGVRTILQQPSKWRTLPKLVKEWLALQRDFSMLPNAERLLIEQFPFRQSQYTLFYTFEGRKANQTLGMLLTRRMESMGLKPLSFSISDYALSIASINMLKAEQVVRLFNPDILGDELENWMLDSPMLKRSFRNVAMVSGLIEQRYHGSKKTMKQVTFSSDLIYDTLKAHDPDHILLQVSRQDAERELLDLQRTANLLIRFYQAYEFKSLQKVSPMAIPIVLDVRSERIQGTGMEDLLAQASLYQDAENMLQDVRDLLANRHD